MTNKIKSKKIGGGKSLFGGIFGSIKVFFIHDLRLVMKNFGEHDGELSSCALAFFLLISFIPLSLVVISVMSFVYNSDEMAVFYLNQLKYRLPSVNIEQITSVLDRIIYSKRYLAFIWVPFLFWWGSFVFDIIERSLEKAFHINQSHKYWKAKIRHFLIIVGISFFALGLTILSHLIAVVKNSKLSIILDKNLNHFSVFSDLVNFFGGVPIIASSITTLLINMFLVFVMYRFVPPKTPPSKDLIKGALFASFSYEVIKSLFSFYISEFNDYSSIFGSLNTIVILMIWIWYTCFLFIIGAEISWVFHVKRLNRT
jgi:membrane protein